MNGWRYADVEQLPRDVYDTLVLMLLRESAPPTDPLEALLLTTE